MKNIEIKAVYKNHAQLKKLILENGGKYQSTMHQVDTYFDSSNGRLKLREIDGKECMLIFYERADKSSSKESNYYIYPTAQPRLLKLVLKKSYGVKVVVDKKRELYILKHTRVHLDTVKKLGRFMELETVITTQSMKDAQKENKQIIKMLSLHNSYFIKYSYSDMLLKKIKQASD